LEFVGHEKAQENGDAVPFPDTVPPWDELVPRMKAAAERGSPLRLLVRTPPGSAMWLKLLRCEDIDFPRTLLLVERYFDTLRPRIFTTPEYADVLRGACRADSGALVRSVLRLRPREDFFSTPENKKMLETCLRVAAAVDARSLPNTVAAGREFGRISDPAFVPLFTHAYEVHGRETNAPAMFANADTLRWFLAHPASERAADGPWLLKAVLHAIDSGSSGCLAALHEWPRFRSRYLTPGEHAFDRARRINAVISDETADFYKNTELVLRHLRTVQDDGLFHHFERFWLDLSFSDPFLVEKVNFWREFSPAYVKWDKKSRPFLFCNPLVALQTFRDDAFFTYNWTTQRKNLMQEETIGVVVKKQLVRSCLHYDFFFAFKEELQEILLFFFKTRRPLTFSQAELPSYEACFLLYETAREAAEKAPACCAENAQNDCAALSFQVMANLMGISASSFWRENAVLCEAFYYRFVAGQKNGLRRFREFVQNTDNGPFDVSPEAFFFFREILGAQTNALETLAESTWRRVVVWDTNWSVFSLLCRLKDFPRPQNETVYNFLEYFLSNVDSYVSKSTKQMCANFHEHGLFSEVPRAGQEQLLVSSLKKILVFKSTGRDYFFFFKFASRELGWKLATDKIFQVFREHYGESGNCRDAVNLLEQVLQAQK